MGNAFMFLDDFNNSVEAYKSAIKGEPLNSDFNLGLGNAFKALQDF